LPNAQTVLLPFSTAVIMRGYTNAAITQQVILAPESGTTTTWTGSGELDHPIGTSVFNTPASGTSPRGFKMTVTMNIWVNGAWRPTQMSMPMTSTMMYYNLTLFVSEDLVDNDWNDAVVTLTWWTAPISRNVADFGIAPKSSTA
jgi:Fucose-binding lectin II (PA-IIL)